MGVTVEFRRITDGPALVIEDAEGLALDFFETDASSAPGGYDDQAGRGDPYRVTTADIAAINKTMRARSPYTVWETLTAATDAQPWLTAIDPSWDLVRLDGDTWLAQARSAVAGGLAATVGRGRRLSVATKVLHLKRPKIFPVLDSLVLEQLGVTDSVPAIQVIEHLRAEGDYNAAGLQRVQRTLSPDFDRSLVRIMDALLWASHPAAGLAPALRDWQHVIRRGAQR